MGLIPNIINENGYSNIGLLSALYLRKNSDEFYGGLFHKENKLFMILNTHKSTYIIFEVSRQQIDDILEEKKDLFIVLKENLNKIFTLPNKIKKVLIVFLMAKVFFVEKTKWIYILPNSFYHWNQYKHLNHNN